MKKCSTAVLLLAASLSLPAHASRPCRFAPDAPDEHAVRRGDTLWDIASLFLQDPWCWPRVWDSNRDQVANPHRIYPGQRIVLDRQTGRLRALDAGTSGAGVVGRTVAARPTEVRLTPSARVIAMTQQASIPVVAPALLDSAARFRLVMASALAGAPRIIGVSDGRRMAGPGDVALVDGKLPADVPYEIVRALGWVSESHDRNPPTLPLLRIGIASDVQRHQAGLSRVRIGEAQAEIMVGDLLLPVPEIRKAPTVLVPAATCDGQVAALLREGERGGSGDVVLLNRGRQAGLDKGSLVAVTKQVRIGADDSRPASAASAAFVRPTATLLVFDALDQAALAVVLRSDDSVGAGDALGALVPTDSR